MTNQQHPITPPPAELVHQWHKEACKDPYNGGTFFESKPLKHIATQAARWGSDQELEACCADIHSVYGKRQADRLRSMRRPKPPSLAKRALHVLGTYGDLSCAEHDTIRQALETLPND